MIWKQRPPHLLIRHVWIYAARDAELACCRATLPPARHVLSGSDCSTTCGKARDFPSLPARRVGAAWCVPIAGAVVQLCWSRMWLLQRNQTVSVPVVRDFIVPLSWDPLLFLHMVLSAFLSLSILFLALAVVVLVGSGSSLLSTQVCLSSWQEQPWLDGATSLGGEGKVGHPCGAGACGLRPSSARPFLSAESQGNEHPLLRVGSPLPSEPGPCSSHPRESSPDFQADCRGRTCRLSFGQETCPSTWSSWLVVALLGSKKKTELLIFFFSHFVLPYFFPPLTFDL